MTNRQHRTKLRPEHTAELQIAAQLPGLTRQLPLPNGTIADLAGPYLIAEIEPDRRWQHGLAQLLEYWDQAFRSPRPILLLIRDATFRRTSQMQRVDQVCRALAVSLWTWDPDTAAFLTGGPTALPSTPDYATFCNWNGRPYTAPADSIHAARSQREPYATWYRIYLERMRNMQPLRTT